MPEQQQTLTIQQALDLAVQHHTAGRLPQAESIYQQILQTDPDQPVALHLLGVIAHQVGKNDIAVNLITKALAIKPDHAEAHYNLSNALRDLGKLDEAVASYHKALAIKPELAAVHFNLGVALQELGRMDEAFTCQKRAVALDPQNDLFWAGLAAALETLSVASIDDNLLQDLLHLLDRPTVRPSNVTRPIISALRHQPNFSQILVLTGAGKLEIEMACGDIA